MMIRAEMAEARLEKVAREREMTELCKLKLALEMSVCATVEASFGPKQDHQRLKFISDRLQKQYFEEVDRRNKGACDERQRK